MAKQTLFQAAQHRLEADLHSQLQRVAQWFVLLMFGLHPLIADWISPYYDVTTYKQNNLLYCLAALVLGVVIIYLIALIKGYRFKLDVKSFVQSVKAYEWALAAYWVIMTISALISPYVDSIWYGVNEPGRNESYMIQTCYIAAFLIVGRLYKPKMFDFYVLCAVSIFVAGYGVFQYYNMDFLGFFPTDIDMINHSIYMQFVATMSNTNMTSTYVAIAFCVNTVLCLTQNGRTKWLFFAGSLVALYGLLVMEVESGYIGILVAGAVCLPLMAKDRLTGVRFLTLAAGWFLLMWVHAIVFINYVRPVLLENDLSISVIVLPFMNFLLPLAAIAGLAAVVLYKSRWAGISERHWKMAWWIGLAALIVIVYAMLPMIAERTDVRLIKEMAAVSRGQMKDEFGSHRGLIWRLSMQLAGENPIFGVGPDALAAVFKERFAQITTEAMGVLVDKAHSEYMQALVDMGFIGLLCKMAFHSLAFVAVRKKLRQPMVLASYVALVCFSVQAFFNFSTTVSHPIVWTLWGVMVASGNAYSDDGEDTVSA